MLIVEILQIIGCLQVIELTDVGFVSDGIKCDISDFWRLRKTKLLNNILSEHFHEYVCIVCFQLSSKVRVKQTALYSKLGVLLNYFIDFRLFCINFQEFLQKFVLVHILSRGHCSWQLSQFSCQSKYLLLLEISQSVDFNLASRWVFTVYHLILFAMLRVFGSI